MSEPQFFIGQLVEHQKFGYRGVVFGVDAEFSLSDEWYEQVALSRPPRDAPWYNVLVDGGQHTTYVAERHLTTSEDTGQIDHPMLGTYFRQFAEGRYLPREPRH